MAISRRLFTGVASVRRLHPRWILGFFLLALCLPTFGCGGDDTSGGNWNAEELNHNEAPGNQNQNAGNGSENFPVPSVPTSIETVILSANPMSAGQALDVECRFLDPVGDPIEFAEGEAPSTRLLLNPNNAFVRQSGQHVARRAGEVDVACQSQDLGLTDANPVTVTIEAGPVYTTTTTLSDYQMVAGENVGVTCEGFDQWGNPVADAPFSILADTSASGIAIDDQQMSVSITTAGLYTFTCHVQGVHDMVGDTVEVIADLPYELLADVVPLQTTYGIGQVITLSTVVIDQFGNEVGNATIDYSSTPTGDAFGQGRFRFFQNGVYTLRAEVTGETHGGVTLVEERDVVVNDHGPTINCTEPYDNAMVNHAPGSNLTIGGTAIDAHGVESVFVDGQAASLDADGNFSATIQPRYGMNFVDIVAQDVYGEESVRTCTFLVSQNWATPTNYINDAVTLRLSQDAIDDGAFDGNIYSLNDMIRTVLNSEGLRQEIEAQIRAGNPYDPDTCNFDMYVNAVYFDGAAHTTSIDLIGGGLRLKARFNDIYIDMTLRDGSWYCFGPYHPTVILEYIEIDLTADLFLASNLPRIQLREVERVESGEVSAEGGNWFSSFVYDSITSLFQGTFRGLIEDTFEDAIVDNFDSLFDGLIGSLDVETLAGTINVPRLDSAATLPLNFGFQFSHVNANSARALFGLAPRIIPGGGSAHAIPTLGVAHPPGTIRLDPAGDTAAAAVHVTLLNQALHSLWRGGLFHANIGSALFGDDIPDGTVVELEAQLPPMAVLENENNATIMLGGLRMTMQYPGIFDDPVVLVMGATASTQINLNGDELSFDGIQLQEFHLSPEEISLNEGTRDILEGFLQSLLQDVVDQSLNAALPALPIPSFTIPASMAGYNLPAGEDIGVVDPTMEQTNRHIILRGEFGVR